MIRTALLAALVLMPRVPEGFADSIPSGKGQIEVDIGRSDAMKVWTYRPENLLPESRIVFVMHGAKRSPDSYREPWISYADQHGWLLLLPEFSRSRYPGSLNYNLLSVTDQDGRVRPRTDWAPQALEAIFDHVKDTGQLTSTGYFLYGHSAGGQFTHRTMLFAPQSRIRMAVAANSGWYTLPALDLPFPEGLQGTGITEDDLRRSLNHPVTILLGELDNDPNHNQLSRRAEAMRQGPHRLARGKFFASRIQDAARNLNVSSGWRMQTVPSVAHSNKGMAEVASKLIAAWPAEQQTDSSE